jgi:hypothetical protein
MGEWSSGADGECSGKAVATDSEVDNLKSETGAVASCSPNGNNTPLLFPSFFLAGFECSSQVDRLGRRRDNLARTQHDRKFVEDYENVLSVGIRAVREGVRWDLCDRNGSYDFRSAAPRMKAAERLGLVVSWDLFHFGYPEDLNPLEPLFAARFADFAYAFADYARRHSRPPRFYVPVNEPSFFAWAGGEVGLFAPHLKGRGWELKLAMVKASIAATEAIRAADPKARLLSVDPVIHVVAPSDAPELSDDARLFNRYQFEAWDIISGRMRTEQQDFSDNLDVVGVNYYLHNQWEHTRGTPLALDDARRRPFRQILLDVYNRYGRPIVVTETAGRGDLRVIWLSMIVEECIAALEAGVDLQGVCLYPIIDMPTLQDGDQWMGGEPGESFQFGLWELVSQDGELLRVPFAPLLASLAYAQDKMKATRRALGERPQYTRTIADGFGSTEPDG